jgi:hypothetical protein
MTIQQSAAKFLEDAMRRQETTLRFCNTWQTDMPHIWTSQGWQCECGELNTEGTDNTLRRSLDDAGFGTGIL